MDKNKLHFIIFALMVSLPFGLSSQNENSSQKLVEENAQREEIQRYFGYEDLLFRYLTIPYDISANVNQQGRYVDIGFVLFALIPLVILLLVYNNKKLFFGLIFVFMLYVCICLHFSFMMTSSNSKYNPAIDSVMTSSNTNIFQSVLEQVYLIAGLIASPIISGLDNITGPKDHITYPTLVILFLAIVFLVLRNLELSDRFKVVFVISCIFIMLWWLLSSGIIWYGYLMLPLGYAFIFSAYRKKKKYESIAIFKGLKILSFSIVGIWIFTASSSRISNIFFLIDTPNQDTGVEIVDRRTIPYTLGMISANQALDNLAANLSVAINKINSDDALILKCGSSLQFEIKKSQYRVFEDNNLSYFYGIVTEQRTRGKITSYYKSVGIKYIILDLLLPSIDRTPEKSLTKKFNAMLATLKDNPSIRLVSTDNQVNVKNPDGTLSPRMGVFPDPNIPKNQAIRIYGSYAVFEIL